MSRNFNSRLAQEIHDRSTMNQSLLEEHLPELTRALEKAHRDLVAGNKVHWPDLFARFRLLEDEARMLEMARDVLRTAGMEWAEVRA